MSVHEVGELNQCATCLKTMKAKNKCFGNLCDSSGFEILANNRKWWKPVQSRTSETAWSKFAYRHNGMW